MRAMGALLVAAGMAVFLVGCGDAADISAPAAGQPGAAVDADSSAPGADDSSGSDADGGTSDGGAGSDTDPDGSGSGDPSTDDAPAIPVDAGELPGLDELPPSTDLAPPPGWLLYAARADVTVPGGSFSFGGPYASCSLISSADGQVILISNFQEGEIKNLAPYFGFTDRGDGFVIWGLYNGYGGERGEEWSGTGSGGATITATEGEFALIAPGGITFDPEGEGIEPDGRAFVVTAEWSGEANENFTAETGPADISVRCLFVSRELLDILAAAAARNS